MLVPDFSSNFTQNAQVSIFVLKYLKKFLKLLRPECVVVACFDQSLLVRSVILILVILYLDLNLALEIFRRQYWT